MMAKSERTRAEPPIGTAMAPVSIKTVATQIRAYGWRGGDGHDLARVVEQLPGGMGIQLLDVPRRRPGLVQVLAQPFQL